MTMVKIDSRKLFEGTNATKDYRKVLQLYVQYKKKESNFGDTEKVEDEIAKLLPDAMEGTQRMLKLYKDAEKAMGADESQFYTPQQRESMIGEWERRLAELDGIKKEMGGTSKTSPP